jgi:hypothetical protein
VVRFASGLASASRERLAIVAIGFVNYRIVEAVCRATIMILDVASDVDFAIVVAAG